LGGTGSGKTTLMHLLNRLYDLPEDCGSITIGGVDIRDINREHLRKNIGMVLQEPFLFSRSIKENISIVNSDADFEAIREVSSIAQVDDAIDSFSKGYDTIVGERGVTLSGGQKQRVAIARMLLQNTPVMVFDDSLSAVDSETDAKIRSALKKRKKNSTVILISHRITTLMQADTILVLDKGRVSDIGTHEELINREGIYKSIYDVQMNMSDIDKAVM
jgi:ATP-binding cassette subfamily B protein